MNKPPDTVAAFAADLAEHGGDPEKITDTSSDMSAAFISGIGEHLPNATMTFDRYHLAAKLSEAVDQVRRTEVTTRPELKHTDGPRVFRTAAWWLLCCLLPVQVLVVDLEWGLVAES